MPLVINLTQLTRGSVRVEGSLPASDLEPVGADDLVQPAGGLAYDLEIERTGEMLRLSGRLSLPLLCRCARCLEPFRSELMLDPWVVEVPLDGEDAVVLDGELADLTPVLREDTVLGLPQHPLCDPGCGGLKPASPQAGSDPGTQVPPPAGASAWSVLDRLKLD